MCWPVPWIVKSDVTSTRNARLPLRSSQAAACERLTLFTVTDPAARSFSLVVSVQLVPSVTPAGGRRGKKFLKEPTTGASDSAAARSDGLCFRKTTLHGRRRKNFLKEPAGGASICAAAFSDGL